METKDVAVFITFASLLRLTGKEDNPGNRFELYSLCKAYEIPVMTVISEEQVVEMIQHG